MFVRKTLTLALLSLSIGVSTIGIANESTAPNPVNRGMYVKDTEIAKLYESMKPYVQKARNSYPSAKRRFLRGLPEGHNFFVVTRLRNSGAEEQVFVSVSEIKDGTVQGYIYNKLQNTGGFAFRQLHSFPESEVYDWVITKSDGEPEGNYVGKYLETLR